MRVGGEVLRGTFFELYVCLVDRVKIVIVSYGVTPLKNSF